jgi:predicted nucleotidyltransferase
MNTIFYKNSNRILRGKLKKFADLPNFVQNDFKEIKKIIQDCLNDEIIVYVFGSFYLGHWNEDSDYDVAVTDLIDTSKIVGELQKKISKKVDIIVYKNSSNLIPIP